MFLGEFFNSIFETENLKKNAENFKDPKMRDTFNLM